VRRLAPLLLAGLLAAPVATPAPAAANARRAQEGSAPTLTVTVVQDDLTIPWGVDFLPDDRMIFTQRPGVISVLAPPYTGIPTQLTADLDDLYVNGETGLLDIEGDPNFATNHRIFTCQGREGSPPRIQVVTWTLSGNTLTRVRDPLIGRITDRGQFVQSGRHGGCRLEFGPGGTLWIGTGDGAAEDNPQNLQTMGGKILRVDPETGLGLSSNPFFHSGATTAAARARNRIYNYGHRNIQGLVRRPGTTQMWSVEHGTFRDDEVNLAASGRNYGWDALGPGYDESPPMTDRSRFPNAVRARWSSGNPTIATSGAVFLRGIQWETWNGAMAVACLAGMHLRILHFTAAGELSGQEVPAQLNGTFGRLRTPVQGPDGNLYVTTSNGLGNDVILRVTPS
jgi:aldose sugar dehydrogenase